jgi:hypothetical protein
MNEHAPIGSFDERQVTGEAPYRRKEGSHNHDGSMRPSGRPIWAVDRRCADCDDTATQEVDGRALCGDCAELYGCEHQYVEVGTAPTGVRCIRCGHFVGSWE